MFIADPDYSSRIPDPDPGVKKTSDPESGSATLFFAVKRSSLLYFILG
jgi:hypothetical protein